MIPGDPFCSMIYLTDWAELKNIGPSKELNMLEEKGNEALKVNL
jgi:hypothetical protein